MVGRCVTLAQTEAFSVLSFHYNGARAELAEIAKIAKIIVEKTAGPADLQRLWSGVLELLAAP
jgi:hypothetical protein